MCIAGSCFTSCDKSCDFGWLFGYPGGTFQFRDPAWQSDTRVPEYPLRTLDKTNSLLSEICVLNMRVPMWWMTYASTLF